MLVASLLVDTASEPDAVDTFASGEDFLTIDVFVSKPLVDSTADAGNGVASPFKDTEGELVGLSCRSVVKLEPGFRPVAAILVESPDDRAGPWVPAFDVDDEISVMIDLPFASIPEAAGDVACKVIADFDVAVDTVVSVLNTAFMVLPRTFDEPAVP